MSEVRETENFFLSTAIISICTLITPHVALEIAEYRLSLMNSLYWKNEERLEQGLSTVKKHSIIAILVGIFVISITALFVSLSTRNLDSRMVTVTSGLSRLLSSIMCFLISLKIPKWMGVYHSGYLEYGYPVGRSTTVLAFNCRWSIYSHFFRCFFYLLPFFCGVKAATIPVSAVLGIVAGKLISIFVFMGRTRYKKRKVQIAFFFAAFLGVLSALAMAHGVSFIQTVWTPNNLSLRISETAIVLIMLFGWGLVVLIVHVCVWVFSRRAFTQMEIRQSLRNLQVQFRQQQKRPMFQSVMFDPELVSKIRRGIGVPDSNANAADDGMCDVRADTIPENCASINGVSGGMASNTDDARDRITNTDNARDVVTSTDDAEDITTNTDDDRDETTNKDVARDVTEEESEENLLPVQLRPTLEETANVEEREDDDLSHRMLLRAKLRDLFCCGKCKMNDYQLSPQRSRLYKFARVLRAMVIVGVSLFFLYITIVNLGASFQAKAVTLQLPLTYAFLYPEWYNSGPMCAFDNQGPNSTIITFPSPEAANNSGFTILHCGACGACSTWQNLQVNWETRTYLASLSQMCSKNLFSGGYDAALQCTINVIGFDEDCAICWVDDARCAIDHCVFIYLQAIMINSVGNFAVENSTITSARCDEAMCGPTFVPCSGATRRRMDIKSDIERPESQQCRNVGVNWTVLFDE